MPLASDGNRVCTVVSYDPSQRAYKVSIDGSTTHKLVSESQLFARPASQAAVAGSSSVALEAPGMSTDAGEMQTFEIGAKVLVYLGNGDEAPGTVLAFEDDFGVYAVELDGIKEVTECSPEQMRAVEEPSDDGNIGNSPHYNERLARARSFNSPNSRLSTAAVTIGESSSAPVASAAAEIAPSPPRSCPHCGAEVQTSQVIVEQMRIIPERRLLASASYRRTVRSSLRSCSQRLRRRPCRLDQRSKMSAAQAAKARSFTTCSR